MDLADFPSILTAPVHVEEDGGMTAVGLHLTPPRFACMISYLHDEERFRAKAHSLGGPFLEGDDEVFYYGVIPLGDPRDASFESALIDIDLSMHEQMDRATDSMMQDAGVEFPVDDTAPDPGGEAQYQYHDAPLPACDSPENLAKRISECNFPVFSVFMGAKGAIYFAYFSEAVVVGNLSTEPLPKAVQIADTWWITGQAVLAGDIDIENDEWLRRLRLSAALYRVRSMTINQDRADIREALRQAISSGNTG